MRFRFTAFLGMVFAMLFGMTTDSGASVSAVLSVQAKLSELEYLRGEDISLSVQIQNNGSSVFVVDDYGEYVKNKISLVVREAESQRLLSPIRGTSALAPLPVQKRKGVRMRFIAGKGIPSRNDLNPFHNRKRQNARNGRLLATLQ